jgi:mycothione reductase
VFLGEARFVGPKLLRVGDDELRADQFVFAAGSRPLIPDIAGLSEVPYVTSDTVMRIDKPPKSMLVLGGGYIAAEMSHIFGSLGTKVTIVARGPHLLDQHDAGVRGAFHRRVRRAFRSASELGDRKGVRNAQGHPCRNCDPIRCQNDRGRSVAGGDRPDAEQ